MQHVLSPDLSAHAKHHTHLQMTPHRWLQDTLHQACSSPCWGTYKQGHLPSDRCFRIGDIWNEPSALPNAWHDPVHWAVFGKRAYPCLCPCPCLWNPWSSPCGQRPRNLHKAVGQLLEGHQTHQLEFHHGHTQPWRPKQLQRPHLQQSHSVGCSDSSGWAMYPCSS